MYQKVVGIFTHNSKPETEIVFSHAAATNFPIHVGQYIRIFIIKQRQLVFPSEKQWQNE